ncbi:MAG: glycerate kinase [Propionibacteriales bacterium]|nr:glycerate kinase [Propionibacteriales bacterium]
MKIVVAPDSFKGTLTAAEAARAIAAGWLRSRPGDEVVEIPLADGGEGTVDAIAAATSGDRREVAVTAHRGPDRIAHWLRLPGDTAVVEIANACGITTLDPLDPLHASTRALGQVIRAALDNGCTRLVVAVGGSASTDGGSGALRELGLRLLAADGADLPYGVAALVDLADVDRSGLRPAPAGGVEILCDVTHPLLGHGGAAAVFGPQKGAGSADVAVLERGLARFAELYGGDPSMPGSGAAGGTPYGLATAWGATLVSGAARVADLAGLDAALAGADLVVSGEGQLDATSTQGKVVGEVLARARALDVPLAVVAGHVAEQPPGVVDAASAVESAGSAELALKDPRPQVEAAAAALALRVGQ